MVNIPNKADGDKLSAIELYKLVASNTATSSTNSSSYQKLASTNIASSAIGSFAEIKLNYTGEVYWDSAGTENEGYTEFELRIGSTEDLASSDAVKTFSFGVSDDLGDVTYSFYSSQTMNYIYQPSQSDIDNGFYIEVYGKLTVVSGTPSSFTIVGARFDEMFVTGI